MYIDIIRINRINVTFLLLDYDKTSQNGRNIYLQNTYMINT